MNILDLRSRLVVFGEFESGSGATIAELESANSRLGVDFPPQYRWFLLNFGWLGVGSSEIAGLGADVPHHLDLVAMTLSERNIYRPYLRKTLIPFMNDGFGNHYCLDTAAVDADECPVVFWNHEKDESQVPDFVSTNLADFLESVLE